MDELKTDRRLDALEARLARVETLLAALLERIDGVLPAGDAIEPRPGAGPVSPAHVPSSGNRADGRGGGLIPGTRIPCTEDVLERLRRIAVPFVRDMVARKVADCARAERVQLVDVAFFERAATF